MPTAWSLFTGVGGFDLGIQRAGWNVTLQCEVDAWRRDILAHHWPGTPITPDVRSVRLDGGRLRPTRPGVLPAGEPVARSPDLICGGFPCQDLSVAGRRAGLAGERSGLFYEFARILDTVQPRWALIENVPGLLTSNGGRDFGELLGTLADIGYGVAWRILDSQHFGVPQRRRRVYIVAHIANGHPRAAAERSGQVLAVGTRCRRDHQTRGTPAPDIAVALAGRSPTRLDDARAGGGELVAATLKGHRGAGGGALDVEEKLIPMSYYVEDHENGTLRANGKDDGPPRTDRQPLLIQAANVRRLTPLECERLQGFPDNWTLIPDIKCQDSRRYAAMGDAVTVPVAEWLGRRIKEAT